MYAIIKAGGKQHKVAVNDTIAFSSLAKNIGETVSFPVVLAGQNDGNITHNGSANGTIVSHFRGKKTISFKKRRRTNSKRKRSARQHLTMVKITAII